MMFAQANSEHCRHKIFNAHWIIDGVEQGQSLFDMIRTTHATNPRGVLSAYRDNAAVVEGGVAGRVLADPDSGEYRLQHEPVHTLMKVETHNHPTAISPFPGAATGAGGEIRDEGATGPRRPAKGGPRRLHGIASAAAGFRAALGGRRTRAVPRRIASPLQIMLEGPIGAAAFNNEFGRPNIAGYFRTFEQPVAGRAGTSLGLSQAHHDRRRPWQHPRAGRAQGRGPVRRVADRPRRPGDAHRPRRRRGVLDGERRQHRGSRFRVRAAGQSGDAAPRAAGDRGLLGGRSAAGGPQPDPDRSRRRRRRACPMPCPNSWTTAAAAESSSCARSPTPNPACRPRRSGATRPRSATCSPSNPAISTGSARLRTRALPLRGPRRDRRQSPPDGSRSPVRSQSPVDMPLEMLLGKPPRTVMRVTRAPRRPVAASFSGIDLVEACQRVLRYPAVADKSFLIHIGDRTVGGLVCRDQLVGPWQVPVSDVAVTALGFDRRGRRGHGDGRAHAAGGAGSARVRAHGRGRGADQRAGGGVGRRSSRCGSRPTGWQRAASTARTKRCSTRSAP